MKFAALETVNSKLLVCCSESLRRMWEDGVSDNSEILTAKARLERLSKKVSDYYGG